MRLAIYWGLLAFAPLTWAQDGIERVAYRETFPDYADPSRYIRIAQASDSWEILEDDEGRFIRVTIKPTEIYRRALIVWDLAPIHFSELKIEVRARGLDGENAFFKAAVSDRFGSSFVLKDLGQTGDGTGRQSLSGDSWLTYRAVLPGDVDRIYERGKEVSPFVFGRGDRLASWENVDFSNRGFKTLFFHVDFPSDSPLLGQTMEVDLRLLELKTVVNK